MSTQKERDDQKTEEDDLEKLNYFSVQQHRKNAEMSNAEFLQQQAEMLCQSLPSYIR